MLHAWGPTKPREMAANACWDIMTSLESGAKAFGDDAAFYCNSLTSDYKIGVLYVSPPKLTQPSMSMHRWENNALCLRYTPQ